jgi:hypothetical protein
VTPTLAEVIWTELQSFAHSRTDAYAEVRERWVKCAFDDDVCAIVALAQVIGPRVGCSPAVATAIVARQLRPRLYQRLLHEAPAGGQPYFTDLHGRSSFWRHRNDRPRGRA